MDMDLIERLNGLVLNKKNRFQVTFSADGTKLLAVDVDGNRYKLDALPKDPELLSTLTAHKVCT